NCPIGRPGSSILATRVIAKRLGNATGRVDLFQLPIGEETQLPAVRRPENSRTEFGSGQWIGFGGVERANPDPLGPLFDAGRDESQPPPIRRNDSGPAAGKQQLISFRREYLKADRGCLR